MAMRKGCTSGCQVRAANGADSSLEFAKNLLIYIIKPVNNVAGYGRMTDLCMCKTNLSANNFLEQHSVPSFLAVDLEIDPI